MQKLTDRFSIDYLRKPSGSSVIVGNASSDGALAEVIIPRSGQLLGALEKAQSEGISLDEAVDLIKTSGLASDFATAMPVISKLRGLGFVGYTNKGSDLRITIGVGRK